MTQKQDPKTIKTKKKTNKKRDWSFYAIIVCLIIMAIPATFLGIIVIQATSDRGKPITGTRFDGDLEPKIEVSKLEPLKETVKGWENVQSVSVDLKTATVRINVLVGPEASKEQIISHATGVRDTLYGIYPSAEYFQTTEAKTMYDIEINVYNTLEVTEENRSSFIYYQLTKTANSETEHGNFLSETRSPEFVNELIQAEKADEEAKVPADTSSEGATDEDQGSEE